MNFCKDCKYFKYKMFAKQDSVSLDIQYFPVHACLHEKSTHIHKAGDIVQGYKTINTTANSCSLMRSTICGEEGKLFEEREDLVYKVIKFFKKVKS